MPNKPPLKPVADTFTDVPDVVRRAYDLRDEAPRDASCAAVRDATG